MKKIRVTPLPRMMSVRPALPDSQEQWHNVVKSTFEHLNRTKGDSDGNMEMIQDRVSTDCGKMAELTASRPPAAAHPVCAIVSHFLQEKESGLLRPHFYISTSTPLCHGCSKFIDSVNAVYGTKWTARFKFSRERHPSYWRFPDTSPSARVAEIIYEKICALFVWSYNGFRAAVAAYPDDDDDDSSDSDLIVTERDMDTQINWDWDLDLGKDWESEKLPTLTTSEFSGIIENQSEDGKDKEEQ